LRKIDKTMKGVNSLQALMNGSLQSLSTRTSLHSNSLLGKRNYKDRADFMKKYSTAKQL
jgi:hypothetical protein